MEPEGVKNKTKTKTPISLPLCKSAATAQRWLSQQHVLLNLPSISYLPHVQQTTLPPKIFINADSQLKWLQIKAESVIIERGAKLDDYQKTFDGGLPNAVLKPQFPCSVMDIMDNYPSALLSHTAAYNYVPNSFLLSFTLQAPPMTTSYSIFRGWYLPNTTKRRACQVIQGLESGEKSVACPGAKVHTG